MRFWHSFIIGQCAKPASQYGIRCPDVSEKEDSPYFLCKELTAGYLNGITGVYRVSSAYFIDESRAEEFDRQFPAKERRKLPGQIFDE